MSEKRFSVRLRRECDGVVYSFFDGDNLIDVDMIVDLLNEQQDTISALKEENEELRRLFEEMKQPITINLTEEDEKELRKLLGLIDDE